MQHLSSATWIESYVENKVTFTIVTSRALVTQLDMLAESKLESFTSTLECRDLVKTTLRFSGSPLIHKGILPSYQRLFYS